MKVITLEKLKLFLEHLEKEFTAPFAKADASGNDIETTYLKVDGVAQKSVTSVLANRAEADADGNVIKLTYIPYTGGTLTGALHVQKPSDDDDSDIPATTNWVKALQNKQKSDTDLAIKNLQDTVSALSDRVKTLEDASSKNTESSSETQTSGTTSGGTN